MHGTVLDTKEVKAARAEEMDWIRSREVLRAVPLEMTKDHGAKIIDLKWIDTTKTKGIRSRLVVREIKACKKESEKLDPADVFAAMPPVEGLKVLSSVMQTERYNSKCERPELLVLDVTRAHFYGTSRRMVFTNLPEGYEEEGKCALLEKTMYGTEDAASI